MNMVIRAKPPGMRTCNRIRTSDLHPALCLWYLVRYESLDSSVILKAAIPRMAHLLAKYLREEVADLMEKPAGIQVLLLRRWH